MDGCPPFPCTNATVLGKKMIFYMLVAVLGIYSDAKQLAGPYDVIFNKIYICRDLVKDENSFRFNTEFSYVNRTVMSYSSNVTFPRGIHDNMKGTVDLAVLHNGVYRKNFINFRFNKVCTEVQKVFPHLIKSFMRAAGKEFTGCPIKAGTYDVQNWNVDLNVATGIFPYNTYRGVIQLFDDRGRKLICVIAEVDIIQKIQ